MAFDGGFLYKLVDELKSAIDCHIDKIYQPSRDELVFLLRKKGFVKRLYITVKPGSARVHFTENKFENPATPPNFCMLLRKYLSGARFIGATSVEGERIIMLTFTATSEMGDTVNIDIAAELMGRYANLVIINGDGKIIDAMKRVDADADQSSHGNDLLFVWFVALL